MIKNISEELLELKWNGVIHYISPNQMLSVTDLFGVTGNGIVALEDRFVGKFLGKIEKIGIISAQEEKTPEIAVSASPIVETTAEVEEQLRVEVKEFAEKFVKKAQRGRPKKK